MSLVLQEYNPDMQVRDLQFHFCYQCGIETNTAGGTTPAFKQMIFGAVILLQRENFFLNEIHF